MSGPSRVRPAEPDDAAQWDEMRSALWPGDGPDEHRAEVAAFFAGALEREPWAVLVAEGDGGRLAGFVELSIRPYAEGCRTRRVAYVEGWYVRPEARGTGVGRALIAAAEAWGRRQGCTELASDAEPDNEVSRLAHDAVGFAEVGLVRCFRKDL